MPFYVELPDRGGVRRRTSLTAWVVAGVVQGTALRITDPPILVGSRPAGEWVETTGPVRIVTEAQWVALLSAAGAPVTAVRAALGTLTPLDRAEFYSGLLGEREEETNE